MSDKDGFWDIDQFLTTRRNQPIGSSRIVDPATATIPIHDRDDAFAEIAAEAHRRTGGQGQEQGRQRRVPRDIAELHGLDEAALQPAVREVVADLISEIGHLNEDLRLAEKRIDYLEGERRHDTFGPWLGRPAFFGQFEKLKGLDKSEHVSSAIALFRISGFRTLRRRHGWQAADTVIVRFGEDLMNRIDAPLGHLADDQFGLLLPGYSLEEAERFAGMEELSRVNGPMGHDPLPVISACCALGPYADPASLLTALERRTYEGLGLPEIPDSA